MSQNQTDMKHRAGRYVAQPMGYRAFIPAPLPPKPSVQMTEDLQTTLSNADRALGRLDGSIRILPNPDLFVFLYARKEATRSSQIEGTQSSLHDLLVAETEIASLKRAPDVYELINYMHAMMYGLERLNELPLSIRLIKEIHAKLLHGVRGNKLQPGELRNSQSWIGATGCKLNEAAFVPPPPDEAQKALGELETFLHNPGKIPTLIWIGLSHAQFETIHPFLDGNGRIGRLLITFLLSQQEILQQPVLYLSDFFKKYREEYYHRLQAVRVTGDWEGWLTFFLRGVAEVSNEAVKTARRILELRNQHRAAINSGFGRAAANGHRILEHLYRQPILLITDVQKITGTAYTAANQLVSRFEDAEILVEITGHKRNRVFRYDPYIALFAEGTDQPLGQ